MHHEEAIAVVGMAVRTPGADDIHDFAHLGTGPPSRPRVVPPGRWSPEQYLGKQGDLGKHQYGRFIADLFSFDHNAFGLTKEQAIRLDPQHRMMMEVGYAALEQAGILAMGPRRDVGVMVGSRMNSYGYDHAASAAAANREEASAALWGRSQNFAAAWLSDRFDLAGPSATIDTACSSSLTAIWSAVQTLRMGSCEAILVGGVDLLIDPLTFSLLSQAGALAPDGNSKTFESTADGYGPGEGAGAVVLKRLSTALRDGDELLGLVIEAAANNDGATMGVTTPNVTAQMELLDSVYTKVDPRRLRYIEAHGTGTLIGDPIEAQALATVLKRHGLTTPRAVALAATKRNVGHLHSASGIVSLIHALIRLADGAIPRVHTDHLNPRLRLDSSPLRVPSPGEQDLTPDAADLVGISAFGFGGTNVHVVAARVPAITATTTGVVDLERPRVLFLSARSHHQLRDLAAQWVERMNASTDDQIVDLVAVARRRRQHHQFRLAVVGRPSDLSERLRVRLLDPTLLREPHESAAVTSSGTPHGGDTAWIEQFRSIVPMFRGEIERMESTTGRTLDTFPRKLVRIAGALAIRLALPHYGVPIAAVSPHADWEPLYRTEWDSAALEQVLPSLLAIEGHRDSETTQASVAHRLEQGDPADLVFASLLARAFEAGHQIDLGMLSEPDTTRTGALPAEAWTGPALNLGESRRSPACGTATVLDGEVDGDGWSFTRVYSPGEDAIMQHEVHGTSMMPGVGWIQLLAEGSAAANKPFYGVDDLLFQRPLTPYAPKSIAVRVDALGRFEVTDEEGRRYVTGKYRSMSTPSKALDVASYAAQSSGMISGTNLYRWLRELGYYHGRYFRNISWLASTPTGTFARVEGGRQDQIDPANAGLSPGLLDSVTIAGIDPTMYGRKDAPVLVPLSASSVVVHGPLNSAAYVVTEEIYRGHETCRLTQHVLDECGSVLLTLHEVTSKRVPFGAFDRERLDNAPTGNTTPSPSRSRSVAAGVTAGAAPVAVEAGGLPLMSWLSAVTEVSIDDSDVEFLDLGLDSVRLVELSGIVEEGTGVTLHPTIMFEYPTLETFSQYLIGHGATRTPQCAPLHLSQQQTDDQVPPADVGELDSPRRTEMRPGAAQTAVTSVKEVIVNDEKPCLNKEDHLSEATRTDARLGASAACPPQRGADVAVVGMAIRTPGANDLGEWWELLLSGRSTVGPAPQERLQRHPELNREASYFARVDEFDPAPFRISPREAASIDPQARIAYENIWNALEDAGGARTNRVGLWVGYSHDHYYEDRVKAAATSGRGLGLEAMVANRLSFIMDWNGPSMTVNTLCSSGLVALHYAMRALRGGECEVAVVAGVHAGIGPEYLESMGELLALSPHARSRAFDAAADGFVPGEGVVTLVLERREDARRHRRRIRAVVRGSSMNHNGRTTRYSAPSPAGQCDVISAALEAAGVPPDSIGLVEAHGTGTALGDPIEVEALTRAWRRHTDVRQTCAIGSLKSVIGHLEPASGLAGMVKVIAAMERRTIPPTLHLERPNDHIRFETTPFYVADRPRPWASNDHPRRAAVSAFGMGGVNAHVIVEEPDIADHVQVPDAPHAFIARVSAATSTAVAEIARRTAGRLREQALTAHQIADICGTLTVGRENQRFRAVLTGRNQEELLEDLDRAAAGVGIRRRPSRVNGVTFIYPGQGSQRSGMGLTLAETHDEFAAAVAEFDRATRRFEVPSLKHLWSLPDNELTRTDLAQVAIVGHQVALTRLFSSWGLTPSAVIGHSVGEFSAAYAAGVLDIEALAESVVMRGRYMNEVSNDGAMAAIDSSLEDVTSVLGAYPRLEVAAINSPTSVTVSGPREEVSRLLADKTLNALQINVSHAFHSAAMADAAIRFAPTMADLVSRGRVAAPTLPFASAATGEIHTRSSVLDHRMWADAITGTVRFWPAMQHSLGAEPAAFLEVSARSVLTPVLRAAAPEHTWVSALRRPSATDPAEEWHALHQAVAQLAAWHEPDWTSVSGAWCLTDVPHYPFEHRPFWVGEDPA